MRNTLNSGGSEVVTLATAKGSKDARVELRTTPEMKEKLRAAAVLSGVDMSSYILTIIAPEVNRTLNEDRLRILSEQEWNKVNEIMNTASQPGNKLRTLMTKEPRYEQLF